MDTLLNRHFEQWRPELLAYLSRLVLRMPVAEDLLQTTYLRSLEHAATLPDTAAGLRAWLFKVATNLAFDELKRHSTWREALLSDLRQSAEADEDFMARSGALISTPETRNIAREHLVACIACTLRNLPERKAASVLLSEVHAFSVAETAALLEATPAQVKNWLQEGRAVLHAHYGATCALLTKQGVCHQCVELDGVFRAQQGSPLGETATLEARFDIARARREQPWGAWHRMMFELLEELK